MKSINQGEIIENIKLLIIDGTDINTQIKLSNNLLKKQIDYKLETKYSRPIELKIISSPKTNLTISEFLVYAGEIMKFDYVDILFGKYNTISIDKFKSLTKNSGEELSEIYNIASIVLTIDESSSCKTFFIESKNEYFTILENWQI